MYVGLGGATVTKVDQSDIWAVINRRFHTELGYATESKSSGGARLHRTIMAHRITKGMTVDHINGDVLDNRKYNLRVCSQNENSLNRNPKKDGRKFKGVRRSCNSPNYVARIAFRGVEYHLGTFATPEEAARAYNDAARRLHGEFARLNKA